MLIGQSVLAPQGGAVYYTPWMPRGGDAFTAVFEVIDAMSGTWDLTCLIQTKNAEDDDQSPGSLGTKSVSSIGQHQHHVTSGAKELVRYRFTATGDTSGHVDKWIHFRSNAPIWQPN